MPYGAYNRLRHAGHHGSTTAHDAVEMLCITCAKADTAPSSALRRDSTLGDRSAGPAIRANGDDYAYRVALYIRGKRRGPGFFRIPRPRSVFRNWNFSRHR